MRVIGPEMHVQAASHFYRALRVYPSPVELLMSTSLPFSSIGADNVFAVYQKVCPAPVFALLLELTSLTGGAGGIGVPPQPGASVIDIDDSSPVAGSPNGKSSGTGSGMGSGGEWERVSDEGRRA
jgi:import receptor subunit TOM20